MLHRLRHDFQLSIITLLGACAALGIAPFALYRFASGNLEAGIIDSSLVLFIIAMVVYAWHTGRTSRAGLILAIFNSTGGALADLVLGDLGMLWLYPVFLSNFLLTRASHAVAINVLTIAFMAAFSATFSSTAQAISFVVTSVVVSVFAFIFAHHAQIQRRQLETLATQDPLTGIANRRTLDKELAIALAAAKRAGMSYGLIMLDLDRFKEINDAYGHDAGDQVLVTLTELVDAATRRSDRLFRFGGEEFILLLPGVNLEGLHLAAENVRQRIETRLQSPGGPVTASLGCALLRSNESASAWLQRADAALYRAKAAGRNRVVTDGLATPADLNVS
jgi:diguanylate cyclase (GGDEF)-like protein